MSRVVDTHTLTPERRRVFELYREGKSVREIAAELDVSIQRIYVQLRKLNVPPPSERGKQLEIES